MGRGDQDWEWDDDDQPDERSRSRFAVAPPAAIALILVGVIACVVAGSRCGAAIVRRRWSIFRRLLRAPRRKFSNSRPMPHRVLVFPPPDVE